MIPIKTAEDLNGIRGAAKIVARVLENLDSFIKPGLSTSQIGERAAGLIKNFGGIAAFKGYKNFPGYICTSPNEVVVHGIPGKYILKDGDIISIDIGVKLEGYYADAAWTFPVGRISPEAERLIKVTQESLYAGIQQIWPGNKLSNVSSAVQDVVESNGYSVVRSFVGHGIGLELHEAPEIPNFATNSKAPSLKAGMVLALEPMVNMGASEVEILKDGWTAVTKDRKLSCHVEHTLAVTKDGSEILTKWQKKSL